MRMTRRLRWANQVVFFTLPTLGCAGLASMFWTPSGVFFGIAFGLVFTLGVLLFLEKGMIRLLQARVSPVSEGLSRYLNEVYLEGGNRFRLNPKILVYSEPLPQFWVFRGLFSPQGVIVLSQGLMGTLSERELRVILKSSREFLSQGRAVFLGYNSFLLLISLKVLPSSWVDLIFSGRRLSAGGELFLKPIQFLIFAPLFAPLKLLLELNRAWGFGGVEADEASKDYFKVMQKLHNTMGPFYPALRLVDRLSMVDILPLPPPR